MKLFLIILLSFLPPLVSIYSQTEGPMKKLYSGEGLEIKFIFYSEGTGIENNGVVILLENKNSYNISYKFKLIFRADSVDQAKLVEGTLIAGERRTGSDAGLYFIPFDDRRTISEVGIKGCKIEKIN